MADNEVGKGRLKGLSAKQKIQVVAIVIIFLIIGWLLYDMLKGSTPPPPPPKTVAKTQTLSAAGPGGTTTSVTTTTATPATPGAPVTSVSTVPPQATQPVLVQTNLLPTVRNPELMKAQQEAQKEYLKSVNELQMLKIQKEIAETNRAIAAAKLATVTADKSMSDLLTRPAQPQPQTVVVAAPPPATPQPGTQPPTEASPPAVAAAAPPPMVDYKVVSVAMQFNRWSAVLEYQGKLYNVSRGDMLPIDGAVVASIDNEGVVLEKSGQRRKIEFITSI